METFTYVPAKNVEEACSLLARYGEDAKILSGGQSLVNMMKQRLISPPVIIDIKGISDLSYIRFTDSDGLRIGGLTTHRSVEKSDIIIDKFPMLAQMEYLLASVAVRNWGTVGGNLCSADPASDLAPTLIALGAEVFKLDNALSAALHVDDGRVVSFRGKLFGRLLCRLPAPIADGSSDDFFCHA